jgi:hypothetical protein
MLLASIHWIVCDMSDIGMVDLNVLIGYGYRCEYEYDYDSDDCQSLVCATLCCRVCSLQADAYEQQQVQQQELHVTDPQQHYRCVDVAWCYQRLLWRY